MRILRFAEASETAIGKSFGKYGALGGSRNPRGLASAGRITHLTERIQRHPVSATVGLED
jgi:hypothetical protein